MDVTAMQKGTRFTGEKFELVEGKQEEDTTVTREEVTFREFGKALNSISKNLKFTFESPVTLMMNGFQL